MARINSYMLLLCFNYCHQGLEMWEGNQENRMLNQSAVLMRYVHCHTVNLG